MSFKLKFTLFAVLPPLIAVIYGLLGGNYALSLNSLTAIGCIVAFVVVNRIFKIVNTPTVCAVIILILLSVFMGRALNFYSSVRFWDKGLHFLSGFIIAPIGTQLFNRLGGDKGNKFLLNTFALSFAISIAGIWEIYEFLIDTLFGTTAQNGSLSDTMIDIIAGSVSGALWLIFAHKFAHKFIVKTQKGNL